MLSGDQHSCKRKTLAGLALEPSVHFSLSVSSLHVQIYCSFEPHFANKFERSYFSSSRDNTYFLLNCCWAGSVHVLIGFERF